MFIKVVSSKVIICFTAVYSSTFGQGFSKGSEGTRMSSSYWISVSFHLLTPVCCSGGSETWNSLCSEFKQTVGICDFSRTRSQYRSYLQHRERSCATFCWFGNGDFLNPHMTLLKQSTLSHYAHLSISMYLQFIYNKISNWLQSA